jgi:hypothetical protein
MKMVEANIKEATGGRGALDVRKLESVFLEHGGAQWSTSISVAAPAVIN